MKATAYWPALRVTLISWLILLCLLVVGMAVTVHGQWDAEDGLSRARRQWQQQKQQTELEASYQPDMHYFLAHRTDWQAHGFMQSPDFDRWDGNLVTIQQQFALPHVAYEVAPTLSCPADACRAQWPASQPPTLNFTVTPIQLRWSVPHESAVIDWLQQLEHAYGGLLLVRRCSLVLAEGAEMIAAQCDLDLFNFPHVLPAELIGAQ